MAKQPKNISFERKSFRMPIHPKKITIINTTLRDGIQSPGVFLTTPEAATIAARLAEAGVDEIWAEIPARGKMEIDLIREIAKVCQSRIMTVWCRPKLCDVKACAFERGA